MANENIQILIEATLDGTKTAENIAKKLPDIESELRRRQSKISVDAKLSDNSFSLIKSQIESLSSSKISLNVDTSKANAQIEKSLAAVQQNIQNSNALKIAPQVDESAVQNTKRVLADLSEKYIQSIKAVTTNMGDDGVLIKAEETLERFKQRYKELGEVSVKGIYTDFAHPDSLNKVDVTIKAITGEVRTLKFELDSLGNKFNYINSVYSDKDLGKQFTKATTEARSLTSELAKVKSGYSDISSNKRVINDDSQIKLAEQYKIVENAIKNVETSTSATFAEMKSQADAAINKLKLMASELYNAEHAATSLRTKDIGTIKGIETNKFEEFKTKVAQSVVSIEKLNSEIKNAQTSLNNISDKDSLIKYLNEFDVLQSKFKSFETLQKSINSYDKSIDNMTSKWEKQGIYVGKIKTTMEGLKQTLSQVTNSSELAAWIESFHRQTQNLDNIAVKAASLKVEMQQVKDVWNKTFENIAFPKGLQTELTSLMRGISSVTSTTKFDEYNQRWVDLQANIARVVTNLNQQADVQNRIYDIQTKLATVRGDDGVAIQRRSELESELSVLQQRQQNLQMQSATLKNLISVEEQEAAVLDMTTQSRQRYNASFSSSQQSELKTYISEIEKAISAIDNFNNHRTFKTNSNNSELQNWQTQMASFKTEFESLLNITKQPMDSNGLKQLSSSLSDVQSRFQPAITSAKEFQETLTQGNAEDYVAGRVKVLISQLEALAAANQKAMKSTKTLSTGNTFAQQYEQTMASLKNGAIQTTPQLRQVTTEIQLMRNEVKSLGIAGDTMWGKFLNGLKKFSSWFGVSRIFMIVIQKIKQMFTTVSELDTSLIDLRKTFKGTESELEAFYIKSNEIAKQLGSTTSEVISSAAAWSRLGFNTASAAEEMAKASSIMKAVSPGMDIDTATTGLVSIVKAFDIDTSDVLDGIISKVNALGRLCRV